MTELRYELALALTCGNHAGRFRQAIGSIADLPAYFAVDGRQAALARADAELQFCAGKGLAVHSCLSPAYPQRLNACADAPAVFFSVGSAHLSPQRAIALVGTRRSTAYGQRWVQDFAAGVAEAYPGTLIISGLAYGIDIAAHRAAIEHGLPTVAVVAHGLNTLYPAAHRNFAADMVHRGMGAIVTEYCHDAAVHRGNFLARNRIVAALADLAIVVESDTRGGSMVTAAIARSYGRTVAAVPGRVTDRYSNGPNQLICTGGAMPLRSAHDLEAIMHWTPRATEGTQGVFDFGCLTPQMEQVVQLMRQNPDADINEMALQMAMPVHLLQALLMEMEMLDAVTMIHATRYSLNV